ncbi:SAF domain-containing protein [Amycolatopsis sp. TRM77291]
MKVDELSAPARVNEPPARAALDKPRGLSRRWENLLAPLIAAVVAIAIFYGISVLRDDTVPVLVLARDVAWSVPLSTEDIATVEIEPAQGVQVIRASQMAGVLGKRLTASLPAGTFLTARELTADPLVQRGEYVVGLRLERDERPARALLPGVVVCVSPLPAGRPCGGPNSGGGAFMARIADLGQSDEHGTAVVDVIVKAPEYERAVAASAGSLVVTVIGL